jgi:ABC-type multidrug transport system ATPase subunit
MEAVKLNKLVKTYNKGHIKAVNEVSFEVGKGELFGLIGPDGAGKTSIFRMLTTLLLPDSGSAQVEGMDIVTDYKKIRSLVGYMPGRFSLYPDLSVEENLNFFAQLFNTSVAANYAFIKDIYQQLEPFKSRRAGKLSGGMKQKLALCCALIHRPAVLFLDEPTTGVDAVSRKEFWDLLGQLKKQGITILVSTPYMDEASLCERIALIQNGTLLGINSPAGIIAQFPEPLYAVQASWMSKLLNDLRIHPDVKHAYAFGEYHHFTFHKPPTTEQLGQFKTDLGERGNEKLTIRHIPPTIEDCFIKLMH